MSTFAEWMEDELGQSSDIDGIARRCGTVIDGMYQYYNATSMVYQPEIALFVALQAIGIICGRVWQAEPISYRVSKIDVRTIPGNTTTDYLTILSKTGTGKETVKTALNKFLGGTGITIAPNVTGSSALYAEAMMSPRLVLLQDEAGLRRQSAGTGRGDPYGQRTAETLLMDVYNNRANAVNPPLYALGRDNPNFRPIKRQAISCVLISTPETYEDALRSDDARSGYLGRHVMIRSDRGRPTKLGSVITDPDKIRAQRDYQDSLLRPFWGWRWYHMGRPRLDTYGQLIRPSQAVAWWISGDHVTTERAKTAHDEMRMRLRGQGRGKGNPPPPTPPVYDEEQPYDIVTWGEGARELLTGMVYADNEAYIAEHPEALDVLARKMQHVAQYAMRIAIARHGIGLRPVKSSQREGGWTEPAQEPQTEEEWKAHEAARYADCESIWDIRQRADADAEAREAAWVAMTTLKTTAPDAAVTAGNPDPNAATATADPQTIYTAKTQAIEDAVKRVYAMHPPVITEADVRLAMEIVDIAVHSSLDALIESIPADRWYEAKEAAVTILIQAGKLGLPTSKLEEKLRKYKLGDKYARLTEELEEEGRIFRGEPAANGGCRLYASTVRTTESTETPEL